MCSLCSSSPSNSTIAPLLASMIHPSSSLSSSFSLGFLFHPPLTLPLPPLHPVSRNNFAPARLAPRPLFKPFISNRRRSHCRAQQLQDSNAHPQGHNHVHAQEENLIRFLLGKNAAQKRNDASQIQRFCKALEYIQRGDGVGGAVDDGGVDSSHSASASDPEPESGRWRLLYTSGRAPERLGPLLNVLNVYQTLDLRRKRLENVIRAADPWGWFPHTQWEIALGASIERIPTTSKTKGLVGRGAQFRIALIDTSVRILENKGRNINSISSNSNNDNNNTVLRSRSRGHPSSSLSSSSRVSANYPDRNSNDRSNRSYDYDESFSSPSRTLVTLANAFQPQGTFQTTYLSTRLRITRGQAGELRVFERVR